MAWKEAEGEWKRQEAVKNGKGIEEAKKILDEIVVGTKRGFRWVFCGSGIPLGVNRYFRPLPCLLTW